MDVQQDGRDKGAPSALADLLERRADLISERLSRCLRERVPEPELGKEQIAALLAELATALRQAAARGNLDEPPDEPPTSGEDDAHWRVGFDIRGVVREYEILQRVIYELLEEEGLRVTLAELSCLARAITRGIGTAVRTFGRRRQQELDEQERARREHAHAERVALEQEMLAIVSHDLRNPLSAILMTAEWILRHDNLEPELVRALERVRASGTRATELIEDLLDYTRARLGGGIPVKPAAARLHCIVGAVIDEVRAAHPARQIEHVCEGDDAGFWDARRVGQGVANVVANAVQHSPPGSVVRARSYGSDDEVCLEVHNEGRSIPAEVQPHLFEPFRQVESGGNGERRVGLGLYIASRVIDAHGGRISIRSDDGRGTTFCVALPRHPR